MKYISITLLFFLGFIQLSCSQKTITTSEWLMNNTIELQPNQVYDFSKLKEVLQNKRIVAIGESTHGLGAFYEMKSALVVYLHKEMGFDVIAMEGGLGDINLAYTDIDSISSKSLRNYTLFGNFKAQEVDSLFNYIKTTSNTKNPLIYAGYDTQFSSNYFMTKLARLLKPINKTMSDSLSSRMYSFQKSYQAAHNNDSIAYIKYRDIYINNAREINKLLKAKKEFLIKEKMLDNEEYLTIQRTLVMFIKSTNLSYSNRFEGYELRDKLMAENLVWLLEEIYPDKKMIIWAHNGHVENDLVEGYNAKLMGHYLKEIYEENYYSIGLFAYEGVAYEHWTKNKIPFKNNSDNAVEDKFFKTNKKAPFLDLSKIKEKLATEWLFKSNTGFELENGRTIPFIPTKRFDGIISIKYSGTPTY